MGKEIGIINYGMGNIRSVLNAIEFLGYSADILTTPDNILSCDRIILPGVGAFPEAMRRLKESHWDEALVEAVLKNGKPFLGICLGMQLLADRGTEHEVCAGLGWIPGEVKKLTEYEPDVKIPHIGWNEVDLRMNCALFEGLGKKPVYYFVHSYAFHCMNKEHIAGTCLHGNRFVACIQKENIMATQFHPEKSQASGLRLLKSFAKI